MVKKQPKKRSLLPPSQIDYMKRRLAHVEQERSRPLSQADIERILAAMQSFDELIRAKAVQQVCPCRMPWDIFRRLRKAAKRLQKDPSPLVRANAQHVEQDAREIWSLEPLFERVKYEGEEENERYQPDKRSKHGRKRGQKQRQKV